MMWIRSENREWRTTPYAGIDISFLRRNGEKGATVLLRFSKGARFPLHNHPGGEELLVLEGVVLVGGERLVRGDYLWTERNGKHDSVAEEASLLFVNTPEGIEVLE
jgi:quercetin dioxygenase-like cupin family protein